MAVCIPNMKMPEYCTECKLGFLGHCLVDENSRTFSNPFIRPDWCPLRECPHSVKEDEKDGND